MRETELVLPVRRHLEALGYRVWADPDGTGYFDVIARRGEEVGLVELKVADWKRVFEQAIRRRGWADWLAVVLPRRSIAEKILARPAPERANRVGVWVANGGQVTVVREAQSMRLPGDDDPFDAMRAEFRVLLDLLEGGALPEGIPWRFVTAQSRTHRRGGRPPTREWKLEEFSAPGLSRPSEERRGSRTSPPSSRT